MSRKSTAWSNSNQSEHGTPGARAQSSSKTKHELQKMQNSHSNILQEASTEVKILSLDPIAGKKKKNLPR